MNLHFSKRKSLRLCRLLAASVIFGLASQAHAVCYVNANATGLNTGSSWTDAWTNLQLALIDPSCAEIWVAKGVYKPTLILPDPTISFNVQPGTAVYGGFAGNETDRDSRNPAANVTILSGDIDNNDSNAGGSEIDDSSVDIIGDNSINVVMIDGTSGTPVTSSTVLDGFTITGGDAQRIDKGSGAGAGLYCNASSGGMCSPTLAHLVFSGNSAYTGSAVFNYATDGGTASPILQDVVFTGNNIDAMADRVYSGTSNPKLSDVTFFNNEGAMSNVSVGGTANPTLERVTFSENLGDNGGGFYNYATGLGGVASPSLTNVTFFGNEANYGGAFFNEINSSGVADPILLNVTFYKNRAFVEGGAIYSHAYSTGPSGSSNPKLYNVILWNNSVFDDGPGPEIYNDDEGTSSIDYSIVQDGCPTGTTCAHTPITADPALGFLADNGGFTKTMLPETSSSAIDAGNDAMCPATDQRGVARPQGTHCDIGAVERQALEDIIFKDGFEDF